MWYYTNNFLCSRKIISINLPSSYNGLDKIAALGNKVHCLPIYPYPSQIRAKHKIIIVLSKQYCYTSVQCTL